MSKRGGEKNDNSLSKITITRLQMSIYKRVFFFFVVAVVVFLFSCLLVFFLLLLFQVIFDCLFNQHGLTRKKIPSKLQKVLL